MIKLINLHKNFGKLEVLKGIDLEIKKGEVVSVIGPSGSGKSTLIRCLNLLEQPTSGDILFKGASVLDKRMDIDEYRQHIGMVFQHFNLFSNMDVLKNLTAALTYVKHIKREALRFGSASLFCRGLFYSSAAASPRVLLALALRYALMKPSISPSMTAPMLPISKPVR